jgi:uncharacterized membrane protein YphA (DoxX/SURF4 family)
MNRRLAELSVPLLRWTLGLVVILESVQFIYSASAAHFLAKIGLPYWLRPALGTVEILAAVLFLVPITARIGSYLMLVIFGLAALIHLLHGQFGVGGLVVYSMAVLVCLSHQGQRKVEA